MKINLSALGITEDTLTRAILSELQMTPEQAVEALADRLGVTRQTRTPAISDNELVNTSAGVSKAKILTDSDVRTLAAAREVLNRVFA